MSAILKTATQVLVSSGVLSKIPVIGGFFGGGEENINYAKKFSKQCGFSSPVRQEVAKYAKTAAGGNMELACQYARPFGAAPRLPSPAPVSGPVYTNRAILDIPATPPLIPSTPPPQVSAPTPTPIPGPAQPQTPPPIKSAFEGPQMSALTSTGGFGGMAALGGALGRLGTIAGIIRGASGKILRVVLPTGRVVTRKNAVKLAKSIGIGAAATALGVSAVDVAQMIMDEQSTRRRRRGITYRDLSNARRVACTVSKMARDLNVKPATRRRTSCR